MQFQSAPTISVKLMHFSTCLTCTPLRPVVLTAPCSSTVVIKWFLIWGASYQRGDQAKVTNVCLVLANKGNWGGKIMLVIVTCLKLSTVIKVLIWCCRKGQATSMSQSCGMPQLSHLVESASNPCIIFPRYCTVVSHAGVDSCFTPTCH